MGELLRRFDWGASALGPVDQWPTSLKTMAGVVLGNRFPMLIWWGPDLLHVYNDGYRPMLGDKHPASIGMPGREVWAEIWDICGPMADGVLRGGPSTWSEHLPLPMNRKGYVEETYFTFSYSPIPDDAGAVGGVLVTVQETTDHVRWARQAQLLRELAERTAQATTTADVLEVAHRTLADDDADFPFVLVYLAGDDGELRLAAGTELAGAPSWALARTGPLVVDVLPLHVGRWPEPVRRAVVLPLGRSGTSRGILVAGVSPRRDLDEAYLELFRQVAEQLGVALVNVGAVEADRERARALAELDEAKTRFFANVSHEFRTPLTLILGPIEDTLGRGGALAGPDLELAHRNTLRLLKLVNALLDFSRLEAGRIRASYREVDLGEITAELAGIYRSAVERAGLRLEVRVEPVGEAVWVDPEMWEKVVLNLLSNALKFTFEGSIGVVVRPAGSGRVALSVSDTGAGIPTPELPRVFDRFHRVEGARARTHEGSGIGLSLVRELVRLHGGEVGVESEPGVGTTFTVTLPTGHRHLPEDRLVSGERPPADASIGGAFLGEALAWVPEPGPVLEPTGSAGRILVVDDNPDLRDYLTRILGAHWRVAVAADGRAGLEAALADPPDLVLSDVMMPGLDGFALLAALRSDDRTREVPVILLSARSGEDAKVDGLAAGADEYLVKPFSARELVARVRTQLALSTSARERSRLVVEEAAARREAEVQREHLFSLFMQAPTPIVILRGPDFVIELANPLTCQVWDRRWEDVIGKPLVEALPELRGQAFGTLLDRVFATGEPHVGKEVPADLDPGDGHRKRVWFNFVYSPLRGASGAVDGVLVLAFDVTDEVRARESVDRLRAESDVANRSKDEFLAMLGHELRNPLAPMVTALQVLALRGHRSKEAEVLRRQVGHLSRLVDDLLDVSRIKNGKLELRRRVVELSDVVLRGMEVASPLLEQRHHRVELDVQREGLRVDGDLDRLAQVVSNLVTNAAKYSDPGSTVEVRATAEGPRVRLSIVDQGIGIAEDMLSAIFEPFTQQPQSLNRSRGGLGLGLSIVKSLVALHGGTVHATSGGERRGSEFVVELPLADAVTTATAAPEPPERPWGSLRILVVDDNRDAAAMLGELLTALGHSVAVAHDGPAALDAAGGFAPEVALLDIGLPAMDGYELAQRLLATPNPPRRLVAITGYGQDTDRARSQAAGFARHLVKPIVLDELEALLREWAAPPAMYAVEGRPR